MRRGPAFPRRHSVERPSGGRATVGWNRPGRATSRASGARRRRSSARRRPIGLHDRQEHVERIRPERLRLHDPVFLHHVNERARRRVVARGSESPERARSLGAFGGAERRLTCGDPLEVGGRASPPPFSRARTAKRSKRRRTATRRRAPATSTREPTRRLSRRSSLPIAIERGQRTRARRGRPGRGPGALPSSRRTASVARPRSPARTQSPPPGRCHGLEEGRGARPRPAPLRIARWPGRSHSSEIQGRRACSPAAAPSSASFSVAAARGHGLYVRVLLALADPTQAIGRPRDNFVIFVAECTQKGRIDVASVGLTDPRESPRRMSSHAHISREAPVLEHLAGSAVILGGEDGPQGHRPMLPAIVLDARVWTRTSATPAGVAALWRAAEECHEPGACEARETAQVTLPVQRLAETSS